MHSAQVLAAYFMPFFKRFGFIGICERSVERFRIRMAE